MNTHELCKLRTIVSSLYGPNPSQEIVSFCENQRQYYLDNISSFQILFSCLETSTDSYFIFWSLDLLNTLISLKYNNFSDQQKVLFRQWIENILMNSIAITSVSFTSNKLSLLIINWLVFDYPENYPVFWSNLITNIFNTQNQDNKIKKIVLMIDLLHTFDEELIKFRNSNSDFQTEQSTKMKDHMRLNVIKDITKILVQVLLNEPFIDSKVISKSIKVVTELISWNYLECFDQFIQIVIDSLLLKINYQGDCIELLNAIIKKGMEPNAKIDIMIKININNIIDSIIKDKGTTVHSFELLSELISNIGFFLPEVLFLRKKCSLNDDNINNINLANSKINTIIIFSIKQLVFCLYFTIQILTHPKFEHKTGLEFVDFLFSTVSYLKNNCDLILLDQDVLVTFQKMHQTIENLLIIPDKYKIATENLFLLEEDDYFIFRKEYALIYRNCFAFSFLQKNTLDGIITKARNLSQKNSLYEIEHCLFLIGIICGIQSCHLKSNTALVSKFNEIISLLFNIPFTQTCSDYILISYYDIICQVIQYILPNKSALELIIKLFLSKKGILIDNPQIGIKIISYFDKFLHKTESQISKLPKMSLTDISFSIKQILQFIINTGNFPLLSEYQLLFHCLAITIFVDNDVPNKIKNYEEALTAFLEIFKKYPINNEMFCEVLKCLIHFVKNINGEIKDNQLKILFVDFFNVFIGDYCTQILPQKQTKTLYGVVTLLQRIIIMLGIDSEQYLSFFFDSKNNFITSDIYEDSIKILQNLINSTKKKSIKFISKHFANLFYFIKKIPLPNEDISDFSKIANSMYYNYMKLVNTIIYEIPEVLFNDIINVSLNEFILFMLNVAKDITDSNTRRNILRSIKLFCAYFVDKTKNKINNQENSNGKEPFAEIMITILTGLFFIYSRLQLSNPYDSSSMCDICQIHFYFSAFTDTYSHYLMSMLSKEQAEMFHKLITKVNIKNTQISNEIIQVFNVSLFFIYLFYLYSILFKSRLTICDIIQLKL